MDNTRPQRKILRSPSGKRRSKALPVNQRVQLQRVLGLTVSSNAGLSCDSKNGTIAYPAGCVVVLFNPRRNKQSHIFNATKKTITCLSFSRDGKHLITGETGHQPAVRIWDVQARTQVAEFRGHKFGISCVAFSPSMKEVVSVGTQHDMMISVWNWKTGNKVASNKISSKVSALAFSEDGKCFVTVGNRHVRFWYLEDSRLKINQTVPLMGRSGILGDQKDNFFCDVVAGQGHVSGRFFVITQSGLLCEFNEKRQLNKWVELRTKTANCITAGQEHIFVGCAEGVVRVFNATSLQFICSLPKPHHLGVEITTATNPSHMVNKKEDAKYPDTKAIAVDDEHKKVTCVYNDRSVYIWDVHDVKRTGKAWSFLYHSGCIWALEMYPPLEDETKAMLPPGSFLTASADDTIRAWNLNTHMPENTAFKRNIYSNELLKIVYVDPSLTFLCNVDYNPAGATDKTDTTYDGKNGVRSIRVSPDGAHLASGDRQGNVRIYDMQYLNEKKCVEAHESDVMCLEYSYSGSGRFLATSSRDRLIHVFDVDLNYGLVQSLGDHSSSITAVRFTNLDNKLQMISCGADKSILIRNAVSSPDFQFQLEHHLATKITLYDMVIDPTQKSLATVCQDRSVRLYNIQTTKEKKCFKGSVGDEGVLLRIHLDPSGSYAATTGTDKNVCILDFQTGDIVATMYGHSEVITGVKFANDLKHLITVSADGCIFVWRLPSEMTSHMKGKLHELGRPVKETDYIKSDQLLMPNPVTLNRSEVNAKIHSIRSLSVDNIVLPEDGILDCEASNSELDFSISQLPNWAKIKLSDVHSEESESSQEQVQPKGRWAQRVDHSLEFKTQLDVTSLDDTFTEQQQAVETGFFNTLPRIRRKTVILSRHWENKSLPDADNLPESTGDVCSSLPSTTMFLDLDGSRKTDICNQYKSSDVSLNISAASSQRWSDRFDLLKSNSIDDTDDLDTESETTEIIYLPADSDSDLFANTYKVFAVGDVKQNLTDQGHVSGQDAASVSTDISVEDEDEPTYEIVIISNPTTPDSDKDFLPVTPEKEEFARETFVEESFTPVPLNKFPRSVDTLESLESQVTGIAADFVSESTPFSPRLSLSAKFMSRAQMSSLKDFSTPQIINQQDSWFNKNKLEMIKAMGDTRRRLLAVNLQRKCESVDSDDPPSPPTKLKEESITFPDTKDAIPSASPQSEAENATGDSPADVLVYRPQVHIHSSIMVTPAITKPFAEPVSEEQEVTRRNVKPKPLEKSKPSNNTALKYSASKLAVRPGPPYFRSAQNSKIVASRKTNESSRSNYVIGRYQDVSSRNVRKFERVPKRKLAIYASTPNLVLSFDAEEKPQPLVKSTSASNLNMLSNLSQNVPDICGAEPSMNNSYGVSNSCRSVIEYNKVNGISLDALGNQQIPSVLSYHSLPSETAQSFTSFVQSRQDAGEPQPPLWKIINSEMTLEQDKNSLLNKSNVVVGINNVTNWASIASMSVRNSREIALSSLSSLPVQKAETFPPVFDSELTHANPTQLAVAESIERTIILHHQKQANSSNAISEFVHSPPSDLEISIFDLPERDQPNVQTLKSSSLPLLLQHLNQCLPNPASFQHIETSQPVTDLSYLISPENGSKDLDTIFEECREANTEEGHNYGKDCVDSYNSQNIETEAVIGSSFESQFDTGVGSESSDTDMSHIKIDISSPGTKVKSVDNADTSIKTETSQEDVSTRLSLQLLSSSPEPISVIHCQSALSDFRSQLHVLKDIFTQVDGRTDETATEVIAMLGDVFHETQTLIADLVTKMPRYTPRNRDSLPINLASPMSQGSVDKTFHYVTSESLPLTTIDVSSNSSSSEHKGIKDTTATKDKSALLAATKNMLQPIVYQLSRDLSEGIWKLIREKED